MSGFLIAMGIIFLVNAMLGFIVGAVRSIMAKDMKSDDARFAEMHANATTSSATISMCFLLLAVLYNL